MKIFKNYSLLIIFIFGVFLFAEPTSKQEQKENTTKQFPNRRQDEIKNDKTNLTNKQQKPARSKEKQNTNTASEPKKNINDDTKIINNEKITTKKEKKFIPKEHFFVGGVSVIAASHSGTSFYVGGNDGFISRYAYPSLKHETWQISSLPIKHIAVHPHKPYLLIYETDDFNVHRVSLLNWPDKRIIFSKRFSGTVVSVSWSAQGHYIFVGHTSNEGITVMNSTGRIQSVFKKAPGVVRLATTGNSERNVITYGQSGRLIYTGLKTHKELMQHETTRNLNQPHLIKRNTEIVGYNNKAVVVINALSGQQISQFITESQPMFANRITDTVPVWIEHGHGPQRNSWQIRRGNAQSPSFRLPQRGEISAAKHIKDHIVVGTDQGFVYLLNQEKNASITVCSINKNNLDSISELQSDAKHFFLQLDNSIYALRDPNTPPLEVLKSIRGNRFNIIGNGFLCWTKDEIAALYYYSLDDKKARRIYRPKSLVKSVSVYNDNVLIVEAFTGLTVIDITSGKKIFSHQATGLQNAVQINSEKILIAKSAGDRNKHPLEIINLATHETLPLKIKGDLAFALQKDKYNSTVLNCFIVDFSNTKKKTTLTRILLNPEQPLKTGFYSIFSYGEEDLNAFLVGNDSMTLTNLGRGKITAYQIHSRRSQQLSRDYSLPTKAELNDQYILSVNTDGSISWYDQKNFNFIKTERLQQN